MERVMGLTVTWDISVGIGEGSGLRREVCWLACSADTGLLCAEATSTAGSIPSEAKDMCECSALWRLDSVVLSQGWTESVEGEPTPINSAYNLSGDACCGFSASNAGECSGIAGAERRLISECGVRLAIDSWLIGVEMAEIGSSVARGPPMESLNVTVATGFSNT
jgi:hypothetical protein